jgi:hypothetical protein
MIPKRLPADDALATCALLIEPEGQEQCGNRAYEALGVRWLLAWQSGPMEGSRRPA